MRYYPENFKSKIKFFLNFIISNLNKFIYKNNYPFLKGMLFDYLKFKTKIQIIETNKNEYST